MIVRQQFPLEFVREVTGALPWLEVGTFKQDIKKWETRCHNYAQQDC